MKMSELMLSIHVTYSSHGYTLPPSKRRERRKLANQMLMRAGLRSQYNMAMHRKTDAEILCKQMRSAMGRIHGVTVTVSQCRMMSF